jgi:hypothetical protein
MLKEMVSMSLAWRHGGLDWRTVNQLFNFVRRQPVKTAVQRVSCPCHLYPRESSLSTLKTNMTDDGVHEGGCTVLDTHSLH